MQLVDLDLNDVNENGNICTLMDPETGATVDDLRIPDDSEYAPLKDALTADEKDVLVTVIEAMGQRKVLPQFQCKERSK